MIYEMIGWGNCFNWNDLVGNLITNTKLLCVIKVSLK